MNGRDSLQQLRDMTVFHELLYEKRKQFRVTFGRAITPDMPDRGTRLVTLWLQVHCIDTPASNRRTVLGNRQSGSNFNCRG
ncbi:MAG: hypothetical protein R3D32_05815 [Nitratireductor sp.]